jgi:hypothetical protein
MTMRWLAAGLSIAAGFVQIPSSGAQEPAPTVTVYKSPTCGCCSKWIEHMRSQGFDVKSTDVDDITQVKTAYGVPVEAASCHTALVRGYVVEGHVPASSVKRLLREKPKVAGLAVPGMPVGSPGMEMPNGQKEPYEVVSFDKAGRMTMYEKH